MAKLGDLEFEIVTSESTKLRNEITEKPIEDGANIGDHINHKPIEFTRDFVISGPDAEDKRDKLEDMSKSDEVFKFIDVKNYRSYENIAILNINFDTDVSISNGYTGSITLKQIKIASQETVIVNLGTDPATDEQVQSKPDETESRDSSEEEISEEKEESVDDSFIYSILNPVNESGDENES